MAHDCITDKPVRKDAANMKVEVYPSNHCEVRKAAAGSLFTLSHTASPTFPVATNIQALGTKTETGTYTANTANSKAQNTLDSLVAGNTYTEQGHTYTVDSLSVNVARSTATILTGDLHLWLSDPADRSIHRQVTGKVSYGTSVTDFVAVK